MTNVPSTMILAVVGIVMACILVGVMLSVTYSQRTAGNKMANKLSEADVTNHEDDFLKYAGTTMSGDTVLSILKIYKDDPIVIEVKNDPSNNGTCPIPECKGANGYHYFNFTGEDRQTIRGFEAAYESAKNKTINGGVEYINPGDSYKCDLKYDANGSVMALVFNKVG